MNNNLMINPANYYNPFAKYNYVSKTRGAYAPQENIALWGQTESPAQVEKSTNIWSDNYDATLDIDKMIESQNNNGIFGILGSLFNGNKENTDNIQ